MNWLINLWHRFTGWWFEVEEPFDIDYPSSEPPPDSDFGCPDTQPTAPGALDSDLGRLK